MKAVLSGRPAFTGNQVPCEIELGAGMQRRQIDGHGGLLDVTIRS
jgi:hypothetical protein